MRAQDFLASVLPSSGIYCAVELSTAKKEHVFTHTLDGLVDAANSFDTKGLDAYFALASFDGAGKRTSEHALKIRSLFLDIDCNGVKGDKEYASKSEGATALSAFLADTGLDSLGTPCIISSGGGLHVYWPLSEDADIEVWRTVAENMKRLCRRMGFKIDHSVTADSSRILRMPGTRNYKKDKPRTVKIMVEASGAFNLKAIADILRENLGSETYTPPTPTIDLPGTRPAPAPTANSVKLIENSITLFKNIEEATAANRGCAQLAYYKDHAADDGMEPLWYAFISIAKKCDDGFDRAKALADMHPYTHERLVEKWNHSKGPTPCIKFDTINHGVCTGCPHFSKITNPLALGRETLTTTEPEVITAQKEVATNVFEEVILNKPIPPKGFSYGSKGGIFKDVIVEGVKSAVMILSYDLFLVDILSVENEHLVHMAAVRPTGTVDIIFPQKAVVSKDETMKALAAQNIIAAAGADNDKNLFYYVRSCVEHASSNKVPVKVPSSYGWQSDKSFVWASTIYYPNGSQRYVPMPGLVNINTFCGTSGTFEKWRGAIDMLIHREFWDILTMSLVGPASLLMEFTGFSGITYHMGSSESGTGKSLAQLVAASFFAQPERYRVTQSTSAVAIQQRAGMLRNFPVITDEVTSKSRENFEWLPQYLLDKSQGKGKDRMQQGANEERVNKTEWKNMDLFSSNTHVLDFLSGARKHSSQAEILRVLEMKLTVILKDENGLSPNEVATIEALKDNYGVVGERIIKWLVTNRETAIDVLEKTLKGLKDEFKATNDERFWNAGNSCIVAMVVLLGKKHMNIIDIPVKHVVASLLKMVQAGRAALKGSKRSAEDILNAYTRENYGKLIVVKYVDGVHEATLGGHGAIDESLTRSDIAGRVEHGVTPEHIDYYIEEGQLKKHCSAMSFGYSDMVDQLRKTPGYIVRTQKKNMMARTRGPQMRMNVLWITCPMDTADEETT